MRQEPEHESFFKGLGAALFFAALIWAGIWFALKDIGEGKFVPGPLKVERVEEGASCGP